MASTSISDSEDNIASKTEISLSGFTVLSEITESTGEGSSNHRSASKISKIVWDEKPEETVGPSGIFQSSGTTLPLGVPYSKIIFLGDSYIKSLHKDWPAGALFKPHFIWKKQMPISVLLYLLQSHEYIKGCTDLLIIVYLSLSNIIQIKPVSCKKHPRILMPAGIIQYKKGPYFSKLYQTKEIMSSQKKGQIVFAGFPQVNAFANYSHLVQDSAYKKYKCSKCLNTISNSIQNMINIHIKYGNQSLYKNKLAQLNSLYSLTASNIEVYFNNMEWNIYEKFSKSYAALWYFRLINTTSTDLSLSVDLLEKASFGNYYEVNDYPLYVVEAEWLSGMRINWEFNIDYFFTYFNEIPDYDLKLLKKFILSMIGPDEPCVVLAGIGCRYFLKMNETNCKNHPPLKYPVTHPNVADSKEIINEIIEDMKDISDVLLNSRQRCKLIYMTSYPVSLIKYHEYIVRKHNEKYACDLDSLMSQSNYNKSYKAISSIANKIDDIIIEYNQKNGYHTCDVGLLLRTSLNSTDMKFAGSMQTGVLTKPEKKLLLLLKEYIKSLGEVYIDQKLDLNKSLLELPSIDVEKPYRSLDRHSRKDSSKVGNDLETDSESKNDGKGNINSDGKTTRDRTSAQEDSVSFDNNKNNSQDRKSPLRIVTSNTSTNTSARITYIGDSKHLDSSSELQNSNKEKSKSTNQDNSTVKTVVETVTKCEVKYVDENSSNILKQHSGQGDILIIEDIVVEECEENAIEKNMENNSNTSVECSVKSPKSSTRQKNKNTINDKKSITPIRRSLRNSKGIQSPGSSDLSSESSSSSSLKKLSMKETETKQTGKAVSQRLTRSSQIQSPVKIESTDKYSKKFDCHPDDTTSQTSSFTTKDSDKCKNIDPNDKLTKSSNINEIENVKNDLVSKLKGEEVDITIADNQSRIKYELDECHSKEESVKNEVIVYEKNIEAIGDSKQFEKVDKKNIIETKAEEKFAVEMIEIANKDEKCIKNTHNKSISSIEKDKKITISTKDVAVKSTGINSMDVLQISLHDEDMDKEITECQTSNDKGKEQYKQQLSPPLYSGPLSSLMENKKENSENAIVTKLNKPINYSKVVGKTELLEKGKRKHSPIVFEDDVAKSRLRDQDRSGPGSVEGRRDSQRRRHEVEERSRSIGSDRRRDSSTREVRYPKSDHEESLSPSPVRVIYTAPLNENDDKRSFSKRSPTPESRYPLSSRASSAKSTEWDQTSSQRGHPIERRDHHRGSPPRRRVSPPRNLIRQSPPHRPPPPPTGVRARLARRVSPRRRSPSPSRRHSPAPPHHPRHRMPSPRRRRSPSPHRRFSPVRRRCPSPIKRRISPYKSYRSHSPERRSPDRKSSKNVKGLALENLREVHERECKMYRENQTAHPDYNKEKNKWFSMMASKHGFTSSSYFLNEKWKSVWNEKMEEIFENSWIETKEKCLSVLTSKRSRSRSHSPLRFKRRKSIMSPPPMAQLEEKLKDFMRKTSDRPSPISYLQREIESADRKKKQMERVVVTKPSVSTPFNYEKPHVIHREIERPPGIFVQVDKPREHIPPNRLKEYPPNFPRGEPFSNSGTMGRFASKPNDDRIERFPPKSIDGMERFTPKSNDDRMERFTPKSKDDRMERFTPKSKDDRMERFTPKSKDDRMERFTPKSKDDRMERFAPKHTDDIMERFVSRHNDDRMERIATRSIDDRMERFASRPTDDRMEHIAPRPTDDRMEHVASRSNDRMERFAPRSNVMRPPSSNMKKALPQLSSIETQNKNVISTLALLSEVSERFGKLGPMLVSLHQDIAKACKLGRNAFSVLDSDAYILLGMTADSLNELVKDPNSPIVQRAINLEAHEKVNNLMETLQERKKPYFGLDIKSLASLTKGMDMSKTMKLIRDTLSCRQIFNASDQEIMNIYIAVKASNNDDSKPVPSSSGISSLSYISSSLGLKNISESQSLPDAKTSQSMSTPFGKQSVAELSQSVENVLNTIKGIGSAKSFPSYSNSSESMDFKSNHGTYTFTHPTGESRMERMKREFRSMSDIEKINKYRNFNEMRFEERSILISYLDEIENADPRLAHILRMMIKS